MTISRRGFLRQLTQISIAITIAPVITSATRFIVPPEELVTIYDQLNFHKLLEAYYGPLLREEIMKENWLLKNIKSKEDWHGGQFIIPFFGAPI